jgi:NDP-sugar pyrophosphorylase family protein
MAENLLGTTPVMILAGGLGTRLRPLVSDRPKGLAPVGSQPFLEIQVELLRDQGARCFVLCVGHFASQIQEYFGDGSHLNVHVDYSVEGEQLLGTGGALKLAERFFAPRALVLNGDTFFALDYPRLLQHHEEERARSAVLATLALAQAPDSSRYGNCVLDATGRYLAGFAEKQDDVGGATGWLSAGAYVLERELLRRVPSGRPCSLEREVFPGALSDGRILAAQTSDELFFDIGTPEGLRAFSDYYAEMRSEQCGIADSVSH